MAFFQMQSILLHAKLADYVKMIDFQKIIRDISVTSKARAFTVSSQKCANSKILKVQHEVIKSIEATVPMHLSF